MNIIQLSLYSRKNHLCPKLEELREVQSLTFKILSHRKNFRMRDGRNLMLR